MGRLEPGASTAIVDVAVVIPMLHITLNDTVLSSCAPEPSIYAFWVSDVGPEAGGEEPVHTGSDDEPVTVVSNREVGSSSF